jgi:hypothetical protein
MKAVKITVQEFARLFDISPRQVQKRCKDGLYWPCMLKVKRTGYRWEITVLKSWYDAKMQDLHER